MKAAVKWLLAASILVNLLMAIALAMPQWLPSMSWSQLPSSASHDVQLRRASEMYQALLERRVPLNVAQRVLAASLPKPVTHDFEYWLSPLRRDMLNEKERIELQSVLRRFLEKTVGSQAAEESAAFAELFRPLQDRFPFLPPKKQIELQRIWLVEKQAVADAQATGGIQAARVSDARSRTEAEIKQLLTDEEMLEYQLRQPWISRALLSSGFEFTEEEFRRSALALLESKNSPASSNAAVFQAPGRTDEKLGRILGPERLKEFRRREQQNTQLVVEARPSADVRLRTLPADVIIGPARTN